LLVSRDFIVRYENGTALATVAAIEAHHGVGSGTGPRKEVHNYGLLFVANE
jgi:hypothetical protein